MTYGSTTCSGPTLMVNLEVLGIYAKRAPDYDR